MVKKQEMKDRDYSKGKIYKIWSNTTTDIYIGSTTKQYLSQRLDGHRKNYKTWIKNNTNKYMSSYEILKYEDHKIELIKLFPCSCIDELHAEEGRHQREVECVNKRISGRTKKEYRIDNKEKLEEYYQDNKEKITEQRSEYYQDNKEKLKDISKQYRIDNKKKINEQANQIVKCECGCEVTRSSLSRHKQSQKHLNNLKNI